MHAQTFYKDTSLYTDEGQLLEMFACETLILFQK